MDRSKIEEAEQNPILHQLQAQPAFVLLFSHLFHDNIMPTQACRWNINCEDPDQAGF